MDGSKVYQQLKQNDGNIEVKVNGYEDIIYNIRSGFQLDLDELPSDENSLGRQIFVRLGTTGQEFPEFLVHPEFLIKAKHSFPIFSKY